jgi:ribonuclease Z
MTFELTILGSSSALPTAERYPTAQVLNVSERFFLIDCGEGTQIQLRRFKISFAKIRHVFISHLHGDHYLGLTGFISTRNLLGIHSDLHIYAHSDLIGLIQPQINYMKGEMGFGVIFHPLNFKKSDLIFQDKKCEVYSFPLKHSIPVCGFLFREKQSLPNMNKYKITEYEIPVKEIPGIKSGAGFETPDGRRITHEELTLPPPRPRSYAFCTDTIPYEPALEYVRDCDLMYHEATFMMDKSDWAVKTLHSTAHGAAGFALKAKAGKLIIGHFSNRYKKIQPFLDEARAIFPDTWLAEDGRKFTIG